MDSLRVVTPGKNDSQGTISSGYQGSTPRLRRVFDCSVCVWCLEQKAFGVFSSPNFLDLTTIIFLFLFGNYCPIID